MIATYISPRVPLYFSLCHFSYFYLMKPPSQACGSCTMTLENPRKVNVENPVDLKRFLQWRTSIAGSFCFSAPKKNHNRNKNDSSYRFLLVHNSSSSLKYSSVKVWISPLENTPFLFFFFLFSAPLKNRN